MWEVCFRVPQAGPRAAGKPCLAGDGTGASCGNLWRAAMRPHPCTPTPHFCSPVAEKLSNQYLHADVAV